MDNKNNKLKHLENLLLMAPPRRLRRSVLEIFFRYLQHAGGNIHTEKFRQLSEDIYFLNKFLEELE